MMPVLLLSHQSTRYQHPIVYHYQCWFAGIVCERYWFVPCTKMAQNLYQYVSNPVPSVEHAVNHHNSLAAGMWTTANLLNVCLWPIATYSWYIPHFCWLLSPLINYSPSFQDSWLWPRAITLVVPTWYARAIPMVSWDLMAMGQFMLYPWFSHH